MLWIPKYSGKLWHMLCWTDHVISQIYRTCNSKWLRRKELMPWSRSYWSPKQPLQKYQTSPWGLDSQHSTGSGPAHAFCLLGGRWQNLQPCPHSIRANGSLPPSDQFGCVMANQASRNVGKMSTAFILLFMKHFASINKRHCCVHNMWNVV